MSIGTIQGSETTSNSSQSLSPEQNRRASPNSSNWPFSPTSPSRIDPLGPIPSNLPRPSTGNGFIPAKSLLKDVVGRRFANGGSPESNSSGLVRPTIHKGRVRFKSSNSMERRYSQGSTSAPDNELTANRSRSDSMPDRNGGTKTESESEAKTDDDAGLATVKRKSVMMLGKKVFSGFKG